MKLIVGLGNPGKKYSLTRHNIGYMAVDLLSTDAKLCLHKQYSSAAFGQGTVFGKTVVIVKPLNFMNLSGEAVCRLARSYAVAPEDVVVIHDDMDIPFGQLRIKTRGGSAGHRGIESIITYLQSNSFIRIRVGIGKPHENIDPSDYVLQNFSNAEQTVLKEVIHKVRDCIKVILMQGPEAAMNTYHRPAPTVL